jgi:hypothetical protein
MSTGTDDFIEEDGSGSDADQDTIESQHQHVFPVPGSCGILSRNACRPSTAPSRQLGRGPKARPTSAASIAESEASAASAASTHIAAFRPNSAHSFLSSRPASALSSRPHSAMSQQQWASSTSVEGADIPRDAVMPAKAPKLNEMLYSCKWEKMNRPATALAASRGHAATAGATQSSHHGSGAENRPRRFLWEWPKLSEMRKSAFEDDPNMRDADDTAVKRVFQDLSAQDLERKLLETFKKIDADGNMALDEEEFGQAFALMGLKLALKDRNELFAEFDVSGNGTVDLEEFRQMVKIYLGRPSGGGAPLAPEILGQDLGIDLVKDDGRHYQFLHTLDQFLQKIRTDIEALRLPKIELETKLGLLYNTVAALPELEVVKAELEELTEERKRKEHLFKTDMTMTRVLDVLSQVVIAHKSKQRSYEHNIRSRQDLVRVRNELTALQKKQGQLCQRLEGLLALRQRIVDEQHDRARGPSHIISARPGGPRCSVRCLSAPVRRIVPRGAHDATLQASSRCEFFPNATDSRACSVRGAGSVLCQRVDGGQTTGVGGTDRDHGQERQRRVVDGREEMDMDMNSQSHGAQSAGRDETGTAACNSKLALLSGEGPDVSGYRGAFVKDGWLFKREHNKVMHGVRVFKNQ